MTMTTDDPNRDLSQLFGPPPNADDMAGLHAALAARADAAGLLDVAYRTLPTPVGTLLLAATPAGLIRVAYESAGLDTVLRGLSTTVSPRVLNAPKRLDDVARQLDQYFAGDRHRFDLPLDLSLSAGFRRTVLAYLPAIASGGVVRYHAVAAAVHNPKAVRAVGTACATNPLPIIIPCHRVIRADGAIGAYLGGPEIKHQLLTLEATP
jgi:methylated-DNA-[protein]-cysteine S-methyltransferase